MTVFFIFGYFLWFITSFLRYNYNRFFFILALLLLLVVFGNVNLSLFSANQFVDEVFPLVLFVLLLDGATVVAIFYCRKLLID